MQSGEEDGSARTARGDGGEGVAEADALLGEGVDVGRLRDLVAVAADLHPQVVGNQEDDVPTWLGCIGLRRSRRYQGDQREDGQGPATHETVSGRCKESGVE